MKPILFFFIFLLSTAFAYSQRAISGNVSDNDGKPIQNATITIKSTNAKVNTDRNGNFSLTVPLDEKTLIFEANGYITQEVEISSNILNVVLIKKDIFDLNLEELMNLEVVTASKNVQKLSKAPASIVVITSEQIESRNYNSLLDVLYDLPGFCIFDRINQESRNVIQMRGINFQNNFIILLNGVRISSPTGELIAIMENYPVHLVKQIEILYGPASSLYGADAVSGVINIITKDFDTQKKFFVNLKPSVSFYNTYNATLFSGIKLNNQLKLIISGQYYKTDQIPLSKIVSENEFNFNTQQTGQFNSIFGPLTPTEPFSKQYEYPMQAYNLYSALHIENFTFSVFSNMYQIPSSFPYTADNAIYNKDVFFRNEINTITTSYSKDFSTFSSQTRMNFATFRTNPKSNYRNVFVGLERGYKYAFGNMWEVEQQFSWMPSEKFTLVFGGDFALFHSIPKTADLDAPVNEKDAIKGVLLGTRLPNNPNGIADDIFHVKYTNTSAYIQSQWDPFKSLSIILGARYDYNSRYGSTLNPRLGLIFNPFSKTIFKLLYGSAFLAPAPYECYQHFGSFYSNDNGTTYYSYYWFLPNPKLKPIISRAFELSFKQLFGSNFGFSINAFYIIVENMYKNVPDSGNTNYYNGKYKGWNVAYIEVKVNQGVQINKGVVSVIEYSLLRRNFRLRSYISLSIIDAKAITDYFDANNNPQKKFADIELLVPWTVKTGLEMSVYNFTISPRLIWIDKQSGVAFENPNNPDKRLRIDGYQLLNIDLSYNPTKFLTLFCSIDNALNQKYRVANYGMRPNSEQLYGAPQPLLSVEAGLKLNF